ncbi:MAG: F0F1 ATP synthase subunit B [Phycisphaerae bacterium]|nr:F0F1 ATP synthase subunit B [Phycisphaerae bacterium]
MLKHRTMAPRLVLWFAVAGVMALPAMAQHGEATPSIFAGDLGNALITLVIFVTVVVVLGKIGWKPVLNLLQQREQTIHDSLVEAKRERAEADKLLADYRAQVDRAREEATSIVEEGKRDAEGVRQRIHEDARKEADKMIARAKREIQLAADDAVKGLYDKTAEIAVAVAGSVIHKELSADEHKQFVRESMERIKASEDARFN